MNVNPSPEYHRRPLVERIQIRWMQIQQLRVWSILRSTAQTRSGAMLILLGAGFIVMSLVTLFIGLLYLSAQDGSSARLEQTGLPAPASDFLLITATPESGQALPTQACPSQELKLGEKVFTIESVDLTAEGGLPAPPEPGNLAFQISGTGERRVFLLGPEAFEAAAPALQGLSMVTYTGEDCSVTTYQLAMPQPVVLNAGGLIELLQSELAIFVQTKPDMSGVLMQGVKIDESINPASAPQPGEGKIQAEIRIVSVLASQVGRLVQVKVSIYNFGDNSLELTRDDVSLIIGSVNSLGPTGSKPNLPKTIQPGQTVEFEILFPLPSEGLGVLRIFTAEFELSDFVK